MSKTSTQSSLPKIGEAFQGGIYAGVSTDKEGALYALILLGDKPAGDLDWKSALAWSKGLEADLPNRVESALLFANLRGQFAEEWHWTNEEHENDASYAWFCYFGSGFQGGSLKSAEGAARAVRRLPLDSFDPLESAKRRTAQDVASLRMTAELLLAACESAEPLLA